MNASYKDIHRIQDSLIPALLETVAMTHIKEKPRDCESYKEMLDIVRRSFKECFQGLPDNKKNKLYRRSDRVANIIINYIRIEKFDTRKMFLAIVEWAAALLNEDAIIVNKEMWHLLEDFGEIIHIGYKEIDNFDKIDAAAINHVPTIHKMAQEAGYFL